MYTVFTEESNLMKVEKMVEQIDGIFTELRLEYLDMAKRYDEALKQIETLEEDATYWEDVRNGLV